MKKPAFNISRGFRRLVLFTLIFSTAGISLSAHPMPNSVVLLDIQPKQVHMELQLPLNELELAFGHDVNKNPRGLLNRLGPELPSYLLSHIHPVGIDGSIWRVKLDNLEVQKVQQSPSGPYHELMANLTITPPAGSSTRDFILNYDVILHQVATHFALVSVRQDWEGGIYGEQPVQLGVIDWDIRNNSIQPFKISLAGGGTLSGFKQTVVLGMHHIAEGTDHLLFLLVLLLAAPLLAEENRWTKYGGMRYSAVRVLKIVTAFTLGHSVTLIVGALGWINFPVQIVEVIIAFSILLSAVHALRPVFFGREAFVATGFGLVHGMAFAGTLVDMKLDFFHLGLSILGFNLGIELMQLLVIIVVFPCLLILSRSKIYAFVRVSGAVISGACAIGWMVERITAKPNLITMATVELSSHGLWIVIVLAVLTLMALLRGRSRMLLS